MPLYSPVFFPTSLNHAVVTPLLKKGNPDPSINNNYRQISNFPDISKILEKVVYKQLYS